MPQRAGKCTNFGLCTMADSREAITLPEGEDFSCPECGKMLAEVEGKGGAAAGGSGGGSKGSGKSKLALAGLAVALLAGGGYFLLVQPPDDDHGGPATPSPSSTPSPTDVTPSQLPTVLPTINPTPVETQLPTPPPAIVQPPTRPPQNPDPLKAQRDALRKRKEELDAQEARLRVEQGLRNGVVPTPTAPPPTPPPPTPTLPPPTPTVLDGPSSGTLIWEGTVHGTELVTIENGVASRGRLMSGKLPGKPVFIQQDNSKKVAVAGAPGPDSHYQRLVLRIQGKGQMKVVLNWSLQP